VPREAKGEPQAGPGIAFPNTSFVESRYGPLAKHPWWRSPIADGDISVIVSKIVDMQANKLKNYSLALQSSGHIDQVMDSQLDRDWNSRDAWALRPSAVLQEGEDTVVIQFCPSSSIYGPLMDRTEARSLLAQGLDQAHDSETLYRKTGKGFGVFDQLKQMEVPDYGPPPRPQPQRFMGPRPKK
jgi:hypothetical protein